MLKTSVIGGGSSYTPELLMGFIERQKDFPLTQLCLMDIDPERLDIVGSFAQRFAAHQDAKFEITLTTDLSTALQNVDYVITQLRVGQMHARREDEYLGKRHGLIGQETTGVGGMAKALRTIPVLLKIADQIRKTSPGALLVNFANPSGLITEALSRYAPDVKAVGVCNAALTTKMEILKNLNERLGTEFLPAEVHLKALGLNHLTWYYGFEIQRRDYWPFIMQALIDETISQPDPFFDSQTLEALGMLPNSYLKYYYYTDRMLELQSSWPPSRSEEVERIEAGLLEKYKDLSQKTLPEELMQRGGAYYSTVAAQLLNAHYNDLNEIHIVNVPHGGAISGWDKDWVLEMPCRVNADGFSPIPSLPLPLVCEGMLRQVKAYELLTVEAAVHGDRQAAYQALLAHPLGPSADEISKVLDDMLETNRDFLPQFFD
ncbi:MAG: 6-phospho-beta-glucosidase [Brevefilum sp.]|jgi:6-phospho-beta-glucosidase